jgi:fumarate hydratase, class I
MQLCDAVVDLLRLAATDIPADVEKALSAALARESAALPRSTLSVTLENICIARAETRAICQDTGVPIFFVSAPKGTPYIETVETLREAVRRATRAVPLRANAVDPVTGRNTGDGVGDGIPVVYWSESDSDAMRVDLLLKGGGSENIGGSYKLPDPALGAERDLEGVRMAVLDAVVKAQGRGCPPYIVGVGIAGTKDDAAVLAKRQLLRKLPDKNPIDALAHLEASLLEDVNTLSIGPSGLSGETTALGVKVGAHARHPATFFVEVSFGCWAHRRRTLVFREGSARYE